MIKFFRKIRQNLIIENKTSKYFKYAIGEIILVVIGILIALQLNNWNTDRISRLEELKLLKEMHHNLESDLEDCIWNINKNKDLHKSNLAVLHHLEERIPFQDSLKLHYGNILGTTTQRRNMSAYDHLKSKGIDLISNDSLRRDITALYSERYYYIEKMELEYDNPIQLNQVLPQINEKLVVDNISKSGYPIDVEILQNDNAFKGVLRTNVYVRWFMMHRYQSLQKDIENLIYKIEKEIEVRRP
jgi:hypothetical protein